MSVGPFSQNACLLERKQRVIVAPGQDRLPVVYLATLLRNLEGLGYTCSPALLDRLQTLSVAEFVQFSAEVLPVLQRLLGAHVAYRPMYPDFPAQVMALSEAELYLNAIWHYLTKWLPDQPAAERPPLLERLDLKVIDLASGPEELLDLIRSVLRSNVALSEADKELIEQAARADLAIEAMRPAEIPLKETRTFVASLLWKSGRASEEDLAGYVQTATDVLRLAVALSDGDLSLAVDPETGKFGTRFRHFTRAEGRLLLALLERSPNTTEDMLRYAEPWKRLGKYLRPGEYRSRYPKAYRAFDCIWHKRPYPTFRRRVEAAFQAGEIEQALSVLAERPGELARRLDHLLRRAEAEGRRLITQRFAELAGQVATPVLLQVLHHFRHRQSGLPFRSFFPKGSVAKVRVIKSSLPPLAADSRTAVVAAVEEALQRRFAKLPALGKVYIDERLKEHHLPFGLRSASKALRTLTRGSRLDLGPGKTVRFFLWWREGESQADIDLSAVLYDAHWNCLERISYYNLRSLKFQAAHSGDITSAPNGAAEFIDLAIDSVLWRGGRYVTMSLNSYSGQPYCDLPECYAGWMMRESPESGAVFEPATVQQRIDVAAKSRICIPVILDLQERKLIWADLALKGDPHRPNNVDSSRYTMALMGLALTQMRRPNLHELFTLHARARGQIVAQMAEADTVFALDHGVTPFDLERIMAEYMA